MTVMLFDARGYRDRWTSGTAHDGYLTLHGESDAPLLLLNEVETMQPEGWRVYRAEYLCPMHGPMMTVGLPPEVAAECWRRPRWRVLEEMESLVLKGDSPFCVIGSSCDLSGHTCELSLLVDDTPMAVSIRVIGWRDGHEISTPRGWHPMIRKSTWSPKDPLRPSAQLAAELVDHLCGHMTGLGTTLRSRKTS